MVEQVKEMAKLDHSSQLLLQVKKLTAENKKLQASHTSITNQVNNNEELIKELREINQQLVLSSLNADVGIDIASIKYSELEQHSQRDQLTGISNRAFMLECIKLAINRTKRHSKNFALLFINLDQFKQVNDKLGHAMGDRILKYVTNQLSSVMRESDTLSRHGGDEFIVLLNEISSLEDVEKVINKMVEVLAEPCYVNEDKVCLTANIGVAIYPQHGLDANTLISYADQAMYRVKKQSSNGC